MSLHRLANYSSLFSVRDVNLCCLYLGIPAQISKVICGHLRSSFIFVTSSWEEEWHWWEMSCCIYRLSRCYVSCGYIEEAAYCLFTLLVDHLSLSLSFSLWTCCWDFFVQFLLNDFFTSAWYWSMGSCPALSFDAFLGVLVTECLVWCSWVGMEILLMDLEHGLRLGAWCMACILCIIGAGCS